MGELKSYKELLVWQKSMTLVTNVYTMVKNFPKEEQYGLASQIKRCAVSIPSNIAEGWGRFSRKDYIRFLRTSRGSLFELETQTLISKNLKFINNSEEIDSSITEISKMLNSLIKKLEEKP
jgi:four helix bundle protein